MLSLQVLCQYKLLQHLNIKEICLTEALTQIVIHEGSNGKLEGIKKTTQLWTICNITAQEQLQRTWPLLTIINHYSQNYNQTYNVFGIHPGSHNSKTNFIILLNDNILHLKDGQRKKSQPFIAHFCISFHNFN